MPKIMPKIAYENAENRYPRRTNTPKNRPPGVRMPNSKSLTEALLTPMENVSRLHACYGLCVCLSICLSH